MIWGVKRLDNKRKQISPNGVIIILNNVAGKIIVRKKRNVMAN